MLRFERQYWSKGLTRVCGVDDAGRGPLAGPVVAAAVCFEPRFAEAEVEGCLKGLTDSKKLTEKRREYFFELLTAAPEVGTFAAFGDVDEIDRFNILRTTHMTMARAVRGLPSRPEHVLLDGNPIPDFPYAVLPIVKGDSQSLSIAAASVIAKVTRDRYMRDMDTTYPDYGFAAHKGYGTSAHIQALFEVGPCPLHRRSFRPVQEACDIRRIAEDDRRTRRS